MSNIDYSLNLTVNQRKFVKMLKRYPKFENLWCFRRKEYNVALVDSVLATASHDEKIILQFLLGVWLGENKYQLDLIEAASSLNEFDRTLIAEWMADPFFP